MYIRSMAFSRQPVIQFLMVTHHIFGTSTWNWGRKLTSNLKSENVGLSACRVTVSVWSQVPPHSWPAKGHAGEAARTDKSNEGMGEEG